MRSRLQDASGKVDLLKGEVAFNEVLSDTLQQVHDLRDTVDVAQDAALKHNLPDAIALLKKADRDLGEIRGCENTRLAGLLRAKVADLHTMVADVLTDQWNALVSFDDENARLSLYSRLAGKYYSPV